MEERIIIAGSRTFNNYEYLKEKLLAHIQNTTNKVSIISGNANGADKLGEQFAKEFNIPIHTFPAKWDTYGKQAGYIRNQQMANFAQKDNAIGTLIAFWDGQSKGTKHMINIAKEYGIKTKIYIF